MCFVLDEGEYVFALGSINLLALTPTQVIEVWRLGLIVTILSLPVFLTFGLSLSEGFKVLGDIFLDSWSLKGY